MNNRKFSDSEIRAYARNRHEEKNLRTRLQKLQQEAGDFHDITTKHRCSLIEECRKMRKTSGGSPSSKATSDIEEVEFDLSSRVLRPWAYSVMETTYNVLYQEATIPAPKRAGSKGITRSSKSVHSEHIGVKPARSRILSSRPLNTSNSLPVPLSVQKAKTFPALYSDKQLSSDGQASSKNEFNLVKETFHDLKRPMKFSDSNTENGLIDTSLDTKPPLSMHINDELMPHSETTIANEVNKTDTDNKNNDIEVSFANVQNEVNKEEKYTNYTEDIREYNTKHISLPAVYKIDSEEYQKSVRQQMLQRARSRNEPPPQRLIPPSREGGINRSKPEHPQTASDGVGVTKSVNNDEKETDTGVDTNKPHSASIKSSKERELGVLKALDSGLNEAIVVKATDLVTYRGKTIHNYIRPEERYKLDPLILKRRQNKMDKLAKESATFLKRVNHENIRVEIAFPRSTRKRLLTRLVDENNFGKSRTFKNGGDVFIQNKVEEFMVSISDYIVNQRIQKENV